MVHVSHRIALFLAAGVCWSAFAADADRSEPGVGDTAPAVSSVPASSPIAPDALLGGLEPLRERAAALGFRVDAGLTSDAYGAGGERGAGRGVIGLFDVRVQVDTAAAGWAGGRAVLRAQWRNGHSPSSFAGESQVTSNIAARQGIDVYEAYWEQRFGAFALRAGYQDFNVDFAATERSALFLNSSFGISPELGEFGPSIFPQTFPGLTVAWVREKGGYVQAAAYRHLASAGEVPVDAGCDGRGPFYAVEGGVRPAAGALAKFGGGAWYDDHCVSAGGGLASGNSGAYALAEGTLPAHFGAASGIEAFVKLGVTRADRNAIARFVGAGLSVRGVFRARPDDAFGIAIARAAGPGDGDADDGLEHDDEAALELTYRAAVLPGLALQPDVQVIRHPGMHVAAPTAVVFTFRTTITF